MPELSRFLGIISINELLLLEGELPPRVLGLVVEWAGLHKRELLENWNLIKETGKTFKIEPLV